MATNTQTLSLRSVLEKDKLSGNNFIDWYRNLRIVLKQEKKLYVLEKPVPTTPATNAPHAERNAHKKHEDDALDIGCLMLATMNSELQKQHENMEAYDMIIHLKKLYQEQARHERFDVSKALFQCKLAEGASVGTHVLKMIGYIENLERLGFPLGQELATDLILQSLPDSYNQFIMNYNMNEIDKSLPDLLNMLRTAEQDINKGKGKTILMVQGKGKGKKSTSRSKTKGKTKPKSKNKALKPKGGVAKEGTCFHCGETGHWKRNCPKYLEELKSKKGSGASTSGTKEK